MNIGDAIKKKIAAKVNNVSHLKQQELNNKLPSELSISMMNKYLEQKNKPIKEFHEKKPDPVKAKVKDVIVKKQEDEEVKTNEIKDIINFANENKKNEGNKKRTIKRLKTYLLKYEKQED